MRYNLSVQTSDGRPIFLDQETGEMIFRIRKHPDWPLFITVEPEATAEDIIRAIAVVERGITDSPDK